METLGKHQDMRSSASSLGKNKPVVLDASYCSYSFMFLKRHYDQDNSYKSKHLIGAGL